MERRFVRKSNDKVFGGVCSGLAEFVSVDKSLVRLLTLVGIVASGGLPGIFLYLLCVVIVPNDTQADDHHSENRYSQSTPNYSAYETHPNNSSGNSRIVLGVVLVAAGVFVLSRMFFNWLDWRYVLAGVLIFGGAYMLFGNRRQ